MTLSLLVNRLLGRRTQRPHTITGHIRAVRDLRTGEELRISYQQVARDAKGRVRAQRILKAR